ncbi:hypothetical protein ABCS02_23970 [Microbacterium sp. X-17]|uniref:hypothetical protein n=1 Tax=Microbacterium sp. X-17 TaxID=3144404 RepID=UPI0031F50F8E
MLSWSVQGAPTGKGIIMRFEEFVGAYPRTYVPVRRPSRVPSDFIVFEGFQRGFSRLLHEFLSGEPEEGLRSSFLRLDAEWDAWGAGRLDQLVRDVSPQTEAETDFDGPGLLVFGQLTFAMRESWRHVFLGERMTGVERRRMQLFLSGLSVNVQKAREWAAGEEEDPVRAAARLAIQAGMLTEFDTAVLLLELAKQHPWLVVLPAPAAFEAAAGRANADLVLLDLERREALGVQVKTRIRDPRVVLHYRGDRVVLVDGWTDLGNTRLVEIARRSDQRLVSWPGLISAHYLGSRSNASQDILRAGNRGWLTGMRDEARRLTVGTTDFRRRALSAVRDRILDRFSRTART